MSEIYFSFSPVRWQDIIDILLNSYILFRLYVLFRGTTVIRIIVGIALLWIFQRVAISLGLIITSWGLRGIIAGAALIIIIVFRNEIRSVLQAKNLKAILWGFPHRTIESPVDIVIQSVYELARKRIGALIVLPVKDDLEDHIQGGVSWQGRVSREMLLSIFWPDNPVHDGAAIIQGNQVTRVGAILPLSNRGDFPSFFGTRHRAAVGLAESSDALIIVVSEERGQVVVAKGDQFTSIGDNLELQSLLQEHIGGVSSSEGQIKKEKMEFKMAAVISFLCVTGIWLSFSQGLETLRTLEVPIEYMNRKADMKIFDTSVNAVNVHLSGSGPLIKSLRPEQVKLKLDLDEAVIGDNQIILSSENVGLPPGVFFRKVEPAVINVTLDRPVEKRLPIQVKWSGKLPDSVRLESVSLQPDTTMVIGASRTLLEVSTAYTEPVNLDNLTKSSEVVVGLVFDEPSIQVAEGFNDKIRVRYILKERKK